MKKQKNTIHRERTHSQLIIIFFWCNRDFDAFDLRLRLPAVVSTLYKAVKRNGGVTYVHCTAGMGRAPAVAVRCINLFTVLFLFLFLSLSTSVFHFEFSMSVNALLSNSEAVSYFSCNQDFFFFVLPWFTNEGMNKC